MKLSTKILNSMNAVKGMGLDFDRAMAMVDDYQVQYHAALALEEKQALEWYNEAFPCEEAVIAVACPITTQHEVLSLALVGGKMTKKDQLTLLGVYVGRLDLTVRLIKTNGGEKYIELVGSKTTSFGNDYSEVLVYNLTAKKIVSYDGNQKVVFN